MRLILNCVTLCFQALEERLAKRRQLSELYKHLKDQQGKEIEVNIYLYRFYFIQVKQMIYFIAFIITYNMNHHKWSLRFLLSF